MTKSDALERVENVVLPQNENATLVLSFAELKVIVSTFENLVNDPNAEILPSGRAFGVAFVIGREGLKKSIEFLPVIKYDVNANPNPDLVYYMTKGGVLGYNEVDFGGGDGNTTPIKITKPTTTTTPGN